MDERGGCLERGILCFDMKKTKIFTMLGSFFYFQNHFFLKHKISVPFSMEEAKTHIFIIHIGYASQKYSLQLNFHFSFFS